MPFHLPPDFDPQWKSEIIKPCPICEARERAGEGKVEVGCLSCGHKFSINEGDEEVNWSCPVCALKVQIDNFELETANNDAIIDSLKVEIKTLEAAEKWGKVHSLHADSLASKLREAEELLRKVAWRSKIHLTECNCVECNAVDAFLTHAIPADTLSTNPPSNNWSSAPDIVMTLKMHRGTCPVILDPNGPDDLDMVTVDLNKFAYLKVSKTAMPPGASLVCAYDDGEEVRIADEEYPEWEAVRREDLQLLWGMAHRANYLPGPTLDRLKAALESVA